ncbi:MAG: sigma-70 family RNA polymerase sigma factor [Fuerstiella sp.]|nr:sigma-70 family RNA polymerase sigma factor [Fuerstiella sp.]
MNSNDQAAKVLSDDEFIRLFTSTQRPLFLHILPLVGNGPDADEVLQETNLIMWAKREQFDPGTSFLAWGRAIARLEVFRFRRTRGKKLKFLEGDLLDRIASQAEASSGELELRREALAQCVQQLQVKDRKLILMRYTPGTTGEEIARRLGRPANSVYQSLGRIRRTLAECIRRRLVSGEVT